MNKILQRKKPKRGKAETLSVWVPRSSSSLPTPCLMNVFRLLNEREKNCKLAKKKQNIRLREILSNSETWRGEALVIKLGKWKQFM